MLGNVSITQISESEIWVGDNKVYLIDGKIIYIIAVGEQTPELAKALIEVKQKLYSIAPGKVHHLIDLNKSGKSSPEARKLWKEFSEDERTDKVAVFGLSPVAKVLASFVMSITNRNNQRFFRTKEEAMQWLLE